MFVVNGYFNSNLLEMTEFIGYLAMGVTVLSFAFNKQKYIRMVNILACFLWIWYGNLINNYPTITVNTLVCLVHIFWFIKRWYRLSKLNKI